MATEALDSTETKPATVPTNEEYLKRYLYLLNTDLRYVAGNPFVHKAFVLENVECINALANEGKICEMVEIIIRATEDKYCPQIEPALFALAVCTRHPNQRLQTAAYIGVQNVCKTAEHLFTFIKFFTQVSEHKGFGMGFRKCINKWYLDNDPQVLADVVSLIRGACGWSHKDILKMTHAKSDNKEKAAILFYVKFGLKEALRKYAADDQIMNLLGYVKRIEDFKHCENSVHHAEMINTHNLKLEHVPGHFLRVPEIWDALIPRIPYRQLLEVLPRLHTYGLLNAKSSVLTHVVEYLSEKHRIKGANLHPVEILIALKNYEKQGRSPDFKKLEHKKQKAESSEESPKTISNPAITNALVTVLQTSFLNLKPSNLRYMICLDARQFMEAGCFKCRNVVALEAAIVLALSIYKTESQDVVIAVFNDKGINLVNMSKGISKEEALARLSKVLAGHVYYSKPFEWAQKKKRKFDVFLFMFNSHRAYYKIPKSLRVSHLSLNTCLKNYREKMNVPDAKLICISLCCLSHPITTPDRGILNICGFDRHIPNIISSFLSETFV